MWLVAEVVASALAVVGHVHVAKTGGSTINQMLANKYHGVCGNKGYSFDYYQANLRGKSKKRVGHVVDSVHKQYPGYDRTRVPLQLMFERGFEACQWVSLEHDASTWHKLGSLLTELHLPCRDPVDHFMSQMNHKGRRIDCATFDPLSANRHLFGVEDRFNLRELPNVTVRCVRFKNQFSAYPAALQLPPKRVVQPLHVLATNSIRKKETECIWKNAALQQRLRDHLLATVDYYQFCAQCTNWVV